MPYSYAIVTLAMKAAELRYAATKAELESNLPTTKSQKRQQLREDAVQLNRDAVELDAAAEALKELDAVPFKEGQMVEFPSGRRGQVEEYDSGDNSVWVRFQDGTADWFGAEDLKLADL